MKPFILTFRGPWLILLSGLGGGGGQLKGHFVSLGGEGGPWKDHTSHKVRIWTIFCKFCLQDNSVVFFPNFRQKKLSFINQVIFQRVVFFYQKITFDHKGEGSCLADPKFGSWDLWTDPYLNTSHNHVCSKYFLS